MKHLIKFYFRHKKLCLFAFALIAAVTLYALPHVAFAAADDKDADGLLKDIAEGFNYLLKFSSVWLWPILLMTGSLLDNDLIFGGAMGERLLDVWVQIRNLVNIIFVLVLLAIAVYNVLGLGEEGGLPLAFKTAIPKFVLALIAVNFSFLAVKVILDFTNVVTGAVFALPTTAVSDETEFNIKAKFKATVCEQKGADVPLRAAFCKEGDLTDSAKAMFSRLDRSNITLVYAMRFGDPINLKFVRDDLKDISQLGFNIIFNAVMYFVYAISFIVLFLVLLLRVVALWIVVVLSPLIAIGIVLPNLKELAGGAGGLQEKFVANAIAPIKIGLVISIGYIMLAALEADKSIHGELLGSQSITAMDPNALPTNIVDLQQLMIAVAMVVIVWVGVFLGAEKTAAEGITNSIKGWMEGFGKWVGTLPKYATVIPIKGKNQSLQQVLGGLKQPFEDFITAGSYKRPFDVSPFKDAASRGDMSAFMSKLTETPGALKNPEVFEAFKDLARTKQRGLYDTIERNNWGPQQFDKVVDAIYGSNGKITDAFKEKFGDDASAASSKIKYDTAVPRDELGQGAPAEVSGEQGARNTLNGADPISTAGNSPFGDKSGWTPTLIDKYRSLDQAAREKINKDANVHWDKKKNILVLGKPKVLQDATSTTPAPAAPAAGTAPTTAAVKLNETKLPPGTVPPPDEPTPS